MRRPLVLLLVVLLVLGGASFALWFWAVGRVQAGFMAWTQQAADQGWTVHAAAMRPAGWPLSADLVLRGLSLTAGPEVLPGGAGWHADQAVLHLSPLAPGTLEVRLSGPQRVRAVSPAEATFEAASLVLTIPLTGADPAHLTGRQVRFAAPLAGMSIGLLDGQGGQSATALSFELSAEAIVLPDSPLRPPALGRHIASATISGTLDGPLPPPSPDPAARAAQWRKSGGLLRVRHMAVGWGPLGVTGNGAFGLDAALQPTGTASVRLVGYDRALSALAAAGAIRPAAAQAIRAVLTLLARTPEGSDTPQVELPLGLHGGVLRAGDIPVERVPRWDWSAPQ